MTGLARRCDGSGRGEMKIKVVCCQRLIVSSLSGVQCQFLVLIQGLECPCAWYDSCFREDVLTEEEIR